MSSQPQDKRSDSQDLKIILHWALLAIAQITSAVTSEQLNTIISRLSGLASMAGGSSTIISLISTALTTAHAKLQELVQAEHEAQSRIIAENAPLGKNTQTLYEGVKDDLTKGEIEYLEKLQACDPLQKFEIPAFDEHGNLITDKTVSVTSAELQEATITLEAYAHKDKFEIGSKERKALNMKLHGHEGEAETAEDLKNQQKTLTSHLDKRDAHYSTLAVTEEERQAILADRKKMSGLVKKVTAPPGDISPEDRKAAEKSLQEHIKKERKLDYTRIMTPAKDRKTVMAPNKQAATLVAPTPSTPSAISAEEVELQRSAKTANVAAFSPIPASGEKAATPTIFMINELADIMDNPTSTQSFQAFPKNIAQVANANFNYQRPEQLTEVQLPTLVVPDKLPDDMKNLIANTTSSDSATHSESEGFLPGHSNLPDSLRNSLPNHPITGRQV